MKFYYTGSETYNTAQQSPLKSLGGFISSSVVPNNSLSNIFTDVSLLAMKDGLVEVRAIILKNTSTQTLENVFLFHTYPATDAKAKIEWAPVTVPNGKSIEEISDSASEPYNISEWYEPVGEDNKILIANSLAPDGVLGLWVKRTVHSPNPADAVSATELEAYLDSLSKTEEIVVNISYD